MEWQDPFQCASRLLWLQARKVCEMDNFFLLAWWTWQECSRKRISSPRFLCCKWRSLDHIEHFFPSNSADSDKTHVLWNIITIIKGLQFLLRACVKFFWLPIG